MHNYDLGSRDAIDQALSRLAGADEIRRITHGLYDLPRFNTLTRKQANPDPRNVIDALAPRDQTRMLIDGMTAANDLGPTPSRPKSKSTPMHACANWAGLGCSSKAARSCRRLMA